MKKSGDKSTLKDQLKKAEIRIRNLERKVEEANRELSQKTDLYQQTMEELSLEKLIINQSPVVLFRRKAGLTGTKPTLEYVSENLKQFGYAPRDFLEEKIRFAEIVHQEDIERLRDEINEYAEADVEEYTQYYRVLTKDGEERWVEDQTSVVRDNQGNKIHNQGILIDITERRRAEEKLKKSEEKFRRIVETAGEG
ncbi:MAG: PAS domain-containing protein, partial [Desulfofustis sp.]|nr:PAS domain-containing protein [Desulfofustis sp.]